MGQLSRAGKLDHVGGALFSNCTFDQLNVHVIADAAPELRVVDRIGELTRPLVAGWCQSCCRSRINFITIL